MTTTGMTHDEAREALEALALDALSIPERADVLAHVEGCAACREELALLEATAAELAYAVRPVPMPYAQRDRVRGRLMNRAAAERAERAEGGLAASAEFIPAVDVHGEKPFHILIPQTPNDGTRHPTHWTRTRATWLAAAASFVAAVSLVSWYQARNERDSIRSAYQLVAGARSTGRSMLDSLRNELDDRDKLIANLTGSQVAVVTLASTNPAAPSARMFWNQSVDAWTFTAHHLPQPRIGRTYQLWLVTAKLKISAGTFKPDSNGNAVVRATYALPKDALAAVAVTDEPEAGSPQPTTVPVIVGTKSTR
ncbi:MAG: anti-sigma factor [bacterium]